MIDQKKKKERKASFHEKKTQHFEDGDSLVVMPLSFNKGRFNIDNLPTL